MSEPAAAPHAAGPWSGGNSAVFLQARLDSSRLPAKALFELGGKPVIRLCMDALRGVPADRYCLLTDQASADILAPFARQSGFQVFTGPKHDVLARFVLAADHFGVDHIWRATADNPLVSAELSGLIQTAYRERGAEYCNLVEVPHGSCIEAVSAQALRTVRAESTAPFEHEHVCPGVYRHPGRYRVCHIEPPPALRRPDVSVTVDTIEDYRRLCAFFDSVRPGRDASLAAFVGWHDRQAPQGVAS
jgi:spore coat polysaccharide biosynthesis protein SpsF